MRNFEDLLIWQKRHQTVLKIYLILNTFPAYELYNLTSQMRRSACSVPTNIAEGCGRNSDAQMKRFLIIANGSCSELKYQLILAKDLHYVDENIFIDLRNEVVTNRRMISSFIEKLK